MHDLLKQMGKPAVEIIDRDLGFELCQMDNVDAIVLGSFVMAGDMFATDVKVLDVSTKDILKSTSSRGEGVASILKSQIDELSREISKGIGLSSRKIDIGSQSIADVTTESMEAYQYFLKGKEAYDKFYFTEAQKHLKKAVEIDPQFSTAYLFLGHAHYQQGDRDSGFESYKLAKAFSTRATEKERLFIEAEYVYWIEGDREKRFQLLTEIAEKYPKEKQVHFEIGSRYQAREMYQDAIAAYLKALELDPNWGQTLNVLGYTYSDMGNYEKALEYFQRYADISPGDANPIDSMAEQYFRMGQLDKAIAKYKEALEIKPDFDAGLRLSIVYAFREDYIQALDQLDRFIARSESQARKAEGYLWKGIFSFLLGKREVAFVNLNESEKLADRIRTGTIDFTKGWMYFELGEYELSSKHLQEALDLFLSFIPDSLRWKIYKEYTTGRNYVRLGLLESAKSRLDTMNTLFLELETPSSKNLVSFQLDRLEAEIFMAEGSPGEAVEILEESVSLTVPNMQTDSYGPYNMPFRRDILARAYHQSGRLDDAIAEYENLVEFVPGEKDWHLIHPIYYLELGKLYEEKNLAAKAIENYEKFLDLWKDADPGLPEFEDAKKRLAELKIS
jgi:tetratricopeptide (TPR) repeat protein